MPFGSRRVRGPARQRSSLKEFQGRGRKRSMWVDYVHEILLAQYESLRTAPVKVGRDMLLEIAFHTAMDPESPFSVNENEENVGRTNSQLRLDTGIP